MLTHTSKGQQVRVAQLALAAFLFLVGCSSRPANAVNPRADALKRFSERVQDYAKLRKKLEGQAPDLKDKSDPARIAAHKEALGEAIGKARAQAKPGDIFSPDVRPLFLRLIGSEMDRTARQAIMDGNPAEEGQKVPMRVNQTYTAPLSTVPPKLLLKLPQLPEAMEYRFVRRHLVLHDSQASLIVDFIVNAVR